MLAALLFFFFFFVCFILVLFILAFSSFACLFVTLTQSRVGGVLNSFHLKESHLPV
jgi:hypothetical protein